MRHATFLGTCTAVATLVSAVTVLPQTVKAQEPAGVGVTAPAVGDWTPPLTP